MVTMAVAGTYTPHDDYNRGIIKVLSLHQNYLYVRWVTRKGI